ncbi:hypothetical protein IZU99_07660 [Oscillospiraceae bacterium CM]|nr:hypothetical protein IZU99_07660 [Oscillospiraceae bacterium CM]
MTEAIRTWVIGLAGAALITAVAMTVTPEGKTKKIVSLICGLMTILALIRPLKGFDYVSFAKNLASYKQEASAFSADVSDADEKLTRRIIEEKCCAYILDKAESLGITDLDVTVTAAWDDDGYWYPARAELSTNAGLALRASLESRIESDLGIPREKLVWSNRNEK